MNSPLTLRTCRLSPPTASATPESASARRSASISSTCGPGCISGILPHVSYSVLHIDDAERIRELARSRPVAVLVEGRPPAIDAAAAAGFTYVIVVATAVAFVAWFTASIVTPGTTPRREGRLSSTTARSCGCTSG